MKLGTSINVISIALASGAGPFFSIRRHTTHNDNNKILNFRKNRSNLFLFKMVLLRATRAGRSASPFLSSFCQNCKLIVRKLHNSANVERIDTKCKFNKFQSDHCSGTMEDSKYILTLPCIFFLQFPFYSFKKN